MKGTRLLGQQVASHDFSNMVESSLAITPVKVLWDPRLHFMKPHRLVQIHAHQVVLILLLQRRSPQSCVSLVNRKILLEPVTDLGR